MAQEIGELIPRGAHPGIFSNSARQSRSYRILEHVPHDCPGVIPVSQNAVVKSLLPKTRAGSSFPQECRALFPRVDRAHEIGIFRRTFEQQVHMIRHQAVHENCKASISEEERDLHGQFGRETRIGEPPQTARRAHSDEIAPRPTIVESGYPRRRIRHASRHAG